MAKFITALKICPFPDRMFQVLKRFLTTAEKSAKIQLKMLKDPLENVQSRPLAPYTVFVKENFSSVKNELKSTKSPLIMSELAKMWKLQDDKDIWKLKADELNAAQQTKYQDQLNSLSIQDYQILQRRRALGKVVGKSLPKVRDPSKPKRLTPHAVYFAKNYDQFKSEENAMAAAHNKFKILSTEEKEVL